MATAATKSKGDSADHVKERILQTAAELFYKEGVHAVGIDRILKEAKAAKASLYAHFGSKDELVATYLDRRGTQWRDHIEAALASHPGGPAERLLLLFDLLAEWTCTKEFRGCPFINAAGELSAPDHPAHAVVQRHRQALHQLIADLVEETGTKDAAQMAQSVKVLYDGATAQALVDGNPQAATTARWALQQLLQT